MNKLRTWDTWSMKYKCFGKGTATLMYKKAPFWQHCHLYSPPDGAIFAAPTLKPNQTIARTGNPEWDSKDPSRASKYLVKEFVHGGIPFTSLLDILGLFLSSISLAPSSATTRNFYLFLTAMHVKWCITLGNSKVTMLNCTWAVARDWGRFFLGASIRVTIHQQALDHGLQRRHGCLWSMMRP